MHPVLYQLAQPTFTGEPTSTATPSATATHGLLGVSGPLNISGPIHRHIDNKYDNVDRLTGAAYTDNGNASFNFGYNYDLNGNRTNVQQTAPSQTPIAATYTYNAANELTGGTINGAAYSYTYNPNGDLTGISQGANTTTYGYDSADRLNAVTVNLSGQPSQTIGYTYDAFNNRASQSANGINTYYLVDPSSTQLLGEFPSGPSAPQPTYYISGLGQQSNGALSYFTMDGLGSVRQLTDANGALSYAANFDPYGNLLEQSQLGGATNLGYTGAPSDPSGLIYLNARFYNPSIGAFQTHDPLEGVPTNPESFNGYSYAQSNPFSNVDPTGKTCENSDSFQTCLDTAKNIVGKLAPHPIEAAGLLGLALNDGFSNGWHNTWDNGLSGYLAVQQENLKNAGEWWSAGGSTQVIGIFFPEVYAVNTIQEWAKGRQAQLSDVLSFLPIAGYAGRVFESLGSLGQLGDGASAVASEADTVANDAASLSNDTGVSSDLGAGNGNSNNGDNSSVGEADCGFSACFSPRVEKWLEPFQTGLKNDGDPSYQVPLKDVIQELERGTQSGARLPGEQIPVDANIPDLYVQTLRQNLASSIGATFRTNLGSGRFVSIEQQLTLARYRFLSRPDFSIERSILMEAFKSPGESESRVLQGIFEKTLEGPW